MRVNTEIAKKALETLAEQARYAVKFMACSTTSPEDTKVALSVINEATSRMHYILDVADV
jgi:hypothetical protein